MPVPVKFADPEGRAGTAVAEGAHASDITTVLKTLTAVGDGAADTEALFAALKAIIPFDRALLLLPCEGGLQCVAAEPARESYPAFDTISLNDFLNVRVVSRGEDKQAHRLAELAGSEESVLILPAGIAGRAAVTLLVRAEPAEAFDDNAITLARLCAAASLASIVRDRRPLANETGEIALQDRLLKVIVDHLPISLTVQDRNGQFILVNAMAAADLAVSAEKLIGSSPADFLSPQEAASRREWEKGVIDGGKTITAETCVTDHEGPRILLTSHTPVFITNNTLLISSSVDITQHKEVERRLTERAHIDKLTGLPDRVRIQEYVESIIGGERRPFALAFIDLDNFKHVNDYYSHAIGDALLIKISERIKAKLKPRDMLARISGDEFLLLLDGFESEKAASPVIEEVLSEIKRPFHLEGFEIFTSCSIGVSFFPTHGRSYETLRRNADGAMYGAKGRAKGQAMYFDDGLGKQIAARMEAEQRLRLAIRDHRFVCAFQPKVDIHTQDVVGFETLVRWRDSDGEIHPPGQFISLAIELGLINPITNFVLTETLGSLERLDAAFGPGKSVSMNVGAKQAADVAFMRGLMGTIKESGAAERLILEITEDAIVEQGAFQSEIVPALREIGVRISIDDFGTGYSSLSALADITADEIKIDRSFVSRIHERPRSQSVLKAIESLARSLGMSMVAEGVETAEELIYLQTASRIRFAQGFYFAKPVYLDEIRTGTAFGGRVQDTRPSGPEKISGRLMAPARAR